MPIQLTKDNYAIEFLEILNSTDENIKIISPFIGRKTSEKLSEFLISNPQIRCKVITRFYREDFIQGASNLDGLESLLKANAEILALRDLHSKLYLFDRSFGIMGSANFTSGGFYYNHELSVLFTEEDEILNNFSDYFDGLWTLLKNDGEWDITLERIEQEKSVVKQCIKGWKKGISRPNAGCWGAKIELVQKAQDDIEDSLTAQEDVDVDTGIWLKFEGTGEDRIPNDHKYHDVKARRGDPKITMFPKKPKGIKAEDILYLTVVSYDNRGKPTPVIIGRSKSGGFNPKNVISQSDLSKYKWMERFPYYIELRETEIIDSEIKNGIPLLDLYRDVGIKAFPSLYARVDLKNQEITHMHFRRSHLHITLDAKKYIDKRLEEIFKKTGKRTF